MATETSFQTTIQISRQPIEALTKGGKRILELGMAWGNGERCDQATSYVINDEIKNLKAGSWYNAVIEPRGQYATLHRLIGPASAPPAPAPGATPIGSQATPADRPRQADHPDTRRSIQAQKAVDLTIDSYAAEFMSDESMHEKFGRRRGCIFRKFDRVCAAARQHNDQFGHRI